ncbi:MAG: phosphoenolpyruvate--protein phosphotransferase [Anaerolineae bacterium]|nr:phosphoenolpyruvate--protein phosphotransferase [Anaerolineae bacterium]
MVGIVLVSHSATLASGLEELINQMVQGKVPLASAGGIDDPENPIGTDAFKVQAAIESVYSDDGVVVLMDLGSALLSAEMALEFLSPEQQEKVYLCPAPLVEGGLAAAVQASVGGSAEQVMAEAQGALAAKIEQISGAPPEPTAAVSPELAGEAIELILTVENPLGLHARPAARFVSTANRYSSTDIRVVKGDRSANAKSINQVATLGVRQGDTITVRASGQAAEEALAAIEALADDNFGDAEQAPAPVASGQAAPTPTGKQLSGIPASPGIAVGPVMQFRAHLPQVDTLTGCNPAAEWKRLQAAIGAAGDELQTVIARMTRQAGADEAAIFEAHALFLQDPDLLESVKQRLDAQQVNAEAAWLQVIEETADRFRAIDDAYMRTRAADVLDVGRRVLDRLAGGPSTAFELSEPSIVVAVDLNPSDTALLDPAQVLGICTELGGATSHSAILARALGIPAVVGVDGATAALPEGALIGLDGGQGLIWPQPDEAEIRELSGRREAWLSEQQRQKESGREPAVTIDRLRVEIGANIGGPNDVPVALEYGAEGVGLLRTEFLFLQRETPPTEDDQYEVYHTIAELMGDRPVIVRTLDIGGDKPVPFVDLDPEDNPFLGLRGIRLCLAYPDLFRTQLRAILRASAAGNFKLMFPMVGSVQEFRAARAVLDEVRQELSEAGVPFDKSMEIGVMVEVPSAVVAADQLAAEVDFFSIGTNDLTQYVMAADRGNARVADLANALQPAVLRMISQTVEQAHDAGIWVGMCGELAGNPLAIPALVGLGLDELSMSAPQIPAVKEAIRALSHSRTEAIACHVLELDSVEAVVAYLSQVKTG